MPLPSTDRQDTTLSLIPHLSSIAPETSESISKKLDEIFERLENGENDQAIVLLAILVENSPESAAVAEAELAIFQRLGDVEQACLAANRFLELAPENPDAMFGSALASMLPEQFSTASAQFQSLLMRWPDHELAAEAEELITMCRSSSPQVA